MCRSDKHSLANLIKTSANLYFNQIVISEAKDTFQPITNF